jgi:chemotaxis signal transduction protein
MDWQRTLDQRAAQLALPPESGTSSRAEETVMIFGVGPDRFAVPLADLVQVLPRTRIAIVPGAPPEVAGLIQLRGEIRPVYRLRRLLGLSDDTRTVAPTLLLLRHRDGEFGIEVDQVDDVRTIPEAARMPASASRGHAGWMTEDLVPVLAIDSLLQKED